MKLTAPGIIRRGQVALDDARSYAVDIARFGDGEPIVVTIESAEDHRTSAQNKFFHGAIVGAFMKLGYHKQAAKDMLALQFIPNDIKLLDGSIVRVPGHTSALNKKDFSDFIEACIQLAAEEGLPISDVDEYRRSQAA